MASADPNDDASTPWRERVDALPAWKRRQLATMLAAVPARGPSSLSQNAQAILCWLASWDAATTDAVAELLRWARGADRSPPPPIGYGAGPLAPPD